MREKNSVLRRIKGVDDYIDHWSLARAKSQTADEYVKGLDPESAYRINLSEMKEVINIYENYKALHSLVDFTDIILQAEQSEKTDNLPIKVLYVDEAQDISLIQWRLIEKLEKIADKVVIAGDDDQAIFGWNGGNVAHFVLKEGNEIVLDQSYRIPPEVQKVAERITGKIKGTRKEKVYNPAEHSGSVSHNVRLSSLDFSQGTWLLMARNNKDLVDFEATLTAIGVPFESKGHAYASIEKEVRNLQKVSLGESITKHEFIEIVEKSPSNKVKEDIKLKLFDYEGDIDMKALEEFGLFGKTTDDIMLNKLGYSPNVVESVKAVLNRFPNEMPPECKNVKIATIHSSKGGEADNVVLSLKINRRVQKEMILGKGADDEHRLFYVAVTRTKKNLYTVIPHGCDTVYQL